MFELIQVDLLLCRSTKSKYAVTLTNVVTILPKFCQNIAKM